MGSESLDPQMLDYLLSVVRVEVRRTMRLKVSRLVNGEETDSHTFEVELGASVTEIQQEMGKLARRWKGGFPIGTRYVVERVE